MRSLILSLALLLSAFAQPAAASIIVTPAQDTYTVSPGQTIQIQVFVDTAPSVAGLQGFDVGLFSEGVSMSYAAAAGAVASSSAIVLPDSLSDDGGGGPAIKNVSAGYAGCFGSLSFSADPFTDGYTDAWLATFTFTAGAVPGNYELSLGKYYPTMSNFVTSTFDEVDSSITFRSASLIVMPEPFTLLILAGGAGAIIARRRGRR